MGTSQIGWSLVDATGNEIQHWGDVVGYCAGIPDLVVLPNGDQVHCPAPGALEIWYLVPRLGVIGTQAGVVWDGVQVVVTLLKPPTVLSFLAFMALFTSAEQQAIVMSTDPQIKLYLLQVSGAGEVSLADPLTVAGVSYLAALGLIAAPRATQVLAT